MKVTLESDDYDKIAREIFLADETIGSLVVEIDGLEFDVCYELEVDGYRDDDYFTGTGNWVTTFFKFRLVGINVVYMDDINVDYDEEIIETKVREYFSN